MRITSKLIITCGAVFAALNGMAWGAWRIGDELEIRPVILREFRTNLKIAQDQTQQNTKALQWLQFTLLDEQFKKGILSDQERQQRCELAYMLRYFSVDGCVWPAQPQQ